MIAFAAGVDDGQEKVELGELRCWRCSKLLGRGFVANKFEIKCPGCRAMVTEKRHKAEKKSLTSSVVFS